MTDKTPPQDDPAQSQRFIDMALEVGADDKAATFNHVLDKVIQQPPALKPEKAKKQSAT